MVVVIQYWEYSWKVESLECQSLQSRISSIGGRRFLKVLEEGEKAMRAM